MISHTKNALTKNFRQRRIPVTNLQNVSESWTLRHARIDAIAKTMILPDAEDQDTQSAENYTARLIVTPTLAHLSNLQIIIDVASREDQDSTIFFTPTLTFRATIPDDSEVFRIVESGSVKKLKRLLSTGAASLGDCDPMGRSLLNVGL